MPDTARETMKMLMAIKDPAARRARVAKLPPIRVKVADLSPTAYCALLQIKGSLPGATPDQLEAANKVFGSVIDQATKVAAVTKGLRELDELGIVIFIPPEDVFCYPHIDLLTEVVDASKLNS